jgi:hypothetical protein
MATPRRQSPLDSQGARTPMNGEPRADLIRLITRTESLPGDDDLARPPGRRMSLPFATARYTSLAARDQGQSVECPHARRPRTRPSQSSADRTRKALRAGTVPGTANRAQLNGVPASGTSLLVVIAEQRRVDRIGHDLIAGIVGIHMIAAVITWRATRVQPSAAIISAIAATRLLHAHEIRFRARDSLLVC